MEQKDYFQRQIDQLGKALAQVISQLLKTGYSGDSSQKMDVIDQVLKDSINFDMKLLNERDNDSFIDYLLNDLQISNNNFEYLAETILIYANENSNNDLYTKALLLFQFVQENSTDYSFEREMKISEIKGKLEKLN